MHNVFVYGTLKRGFGNNRLIKDQEFMGSCATKDHFNMVSLGGFPGVLSFEEQDNPAIIRGELYCVDDDALQSMDCLEGHPDFYERKQVETTLGKAWMYLLPREGYIDRPQVDKNDNGEFYW
jgi:gamma-glutamylcyclotransferase (GGCT)/AIG2-like uncharacterized protein YtfP